MKIQFNRTVSLDKISKYGDIDPKYFHKFDELDIETYTQPINNEVFIYLPDGSTLTNVPFDSFSILTNLKKSISLFP